MLPHKEQGGGESLLKISKAQYSDNVGCCNYGCHQLRVQDDWGGGGSEVLCLLNKRKGALWSTEGNILTSIVAALVLQKRLLFGSPMILHWGEQQQA